MKKDISNLACPKCNKVITDKDLKDWKCVKCGADFKITFEKLKELHDLDTKYLKILTTEPQREVIMRAIKKVMAKEGVKEGRGLELVCGDYLAGN